METVKTGEPPATGIEAIRESRWSWPRIHRLVECDSPGAPTCAVRVQSERSRPEDTNSRRKLSLNPKPDVL